MQIGAVSFRPYVYNTNAVGPKSMNKIAAIGDDLTSSKLDATALVSDEAKKQQNINPLKPGQSMDFAGILQMQMQMSRMNEARVMKPQENSENPSLKAEPAVPEIQNEMQESAQGAIAIDELSAMGLQ